MSLMAAAARALRAVGNFQASTSPLVFCSYNILANKYATGGWHSTCPPQFLDWSYRSPRIVAELLGLNADILCLQEVERDFYEDELLPALGRHGYQGLYYGRQVKPTDFIKGPEEGIALLFRAARLTRITSRAYRLGDLVDGGLRGDFWRRVRVLEDGVIWALLQDQQAGRPILVGCTHLFWDPRWPDVKVAQAHLVCQAGQDLLKKAGLTANIKGSPIFSAPPIPVLLGGDFNSLPVKGVSDQFDTVPPGKKLVSGVYTLLTEGALGPNHHDHPAVRRPGDAGGLGQVHFSTCGLRLSSALCRAWASEPPTTNHTAAFSGCLDYLWVSPQHWEVVGALEMPYQWEAPAEGPVAGEAAGAGAQGSGTAGASGAQGGGMGERPGAGAAAAAWPLGQAGAGGAAGGQESHEGRLPPLETFPPCPNEHQSSDHLAIGAQLVLRSWQAAVLKSQLVQRG